MAQTPEGRVKAAVRKVLDTYGVWYYMPVQTGWGTAGIPDFVCCDRGLFLSIETKAPGKLNNLSPHQRRIGAEIQQAKGIWLVVDNAQVVEDYFSGRAKKIAVKGKIKKPKRKA